MMYVESGLQVEGDGCWWQGGCGEQLGGRNGAGFEKNFQGLVAELSIIARAEGLLGKEISTGSSMEIQDSSWKHHELSSTSSRPFRSSPPSFANFLPLQTLLSNSNPRRTSRKSSIVNSPLGSFDPTLVSFRPFRPHQTPGVSSRIARAMYFQKSQL